jgi:transcriptional regulator with XRE-family HTH domain
MDGATSHSDGLRRLRDWIASRRLTQGEFAKMVRIKQQSVSQIMRGLVTPSTGVLHAIEALTGIETEAWLTETERARVEHAREATEAA